MPVKPIDMKKKTLSFLLLALLMSACGQNQTTIEYSKETGEEGVYYNFISKATGEDELTADLEQVLGVIQDDAIFDTDKLLFFINATNGYMAIWDYGSEQEESNDIIGAWVELDTLWEVMDDSYDFDFAVSGALLGSLNSRKGKQLKKGFEVYYQTEGDDPELID